MKQSAKLIEIVEVGMRDGLQATQAVLSTNVKCHFIKEISKCGFRKMDIASFVNPSWMPQLADGEEVLETMQA